MVTDSILIAAVSLMLISDFLLRKWKGEEGTYSWRIAAWSQKYPLIPFLTGILFGHLFWPNHAYCH